jgi:DNA polymerase III epsilon subunit-like protein
MTTTANAAARFIGLDIETTGLDAVAWLVAASILLEPINPPTGYSTMSETVSH